MAFKNEYIPPLEQETSEFLKNARETMRAGYYERDKWTVDREREMVLKFVSSGHEMESAHQGIWRFMDRKGYYAFTTEELKKQEISPDEIAITYELGLFTGSSPYVLPDAETIACIKEALSEYKDWGVISDYKRCQLTLIDARTGKEI